MSKLYEECQTCKGKGYIPVNNSRGAVGTMGHSGNIRTYPNRDVCYHGRLECIATDECIEINRGTL